MSATAPNMPFGNYQLRSYAGAHGYVYGSAGTEDTERENRAAFGRRRRAGDP
ncbi:MAG: hypothetical protein JO044_10820 [Mycobacteriaceae bacterium]|nr:hypothetical protein [Mycobacteriaceae bacterium]MBV9638761.1 hypothetical protein [Mycobacteriaceae bacterium]